MNPSGSPSHVRPGTLIWCVRIHEDELKGIGHPFSRKKKYGRGTECVRTYELTGKLRPALVVDAREECRDRIVWYTCTREDPAPGHWFEVTDLTRPPYPKRAFLKPDASQIRRVPATRAWFGKDIGSIDRVLYDSVLKAAQTVQFLTI